MNQKKPCAICGKIMDVQPSVINRKKYCSLLCAKIAWKGKRRSPRTEFYKGMRGTRWNDGTTHNKGYRFRMCPEHPRANSNGYVADHILAWERANAKLLPNGWCVHHLNGVKDDNRPENLVAMPRKHHHPSLDPGYIKQRVRELETEVSEWKEKYERLLHERGNPAKHA